MAADLERLRLELALEVDERVERGMCGCGCPTALPVPRGRRRYVNDRHRQRAYRHRLEREADALGIPARLSLESLQGTIRTSERHADAQSAASAARRGQTRPRLGVTLYLSTPGLARRLLADLRGPRTDGANLSDVDAEILARALTAALERGARRERARLAP